MFIQNCIVTIGTVPLLIFAREKPPTPPSESASRKQEEFNFRKEIRVLASNKSYLLLCVSFTTLYGVYTAVGAVVSALTKPYGFSPTHNAIFGGTFILSGVTGSFVVSMILDKTQKFKRIINIIGFCSILSIIAGYFTLPTGNVALFSINLVFVGASVIPVIPVSYAFAVELTYPCPEAMSNGMMILPSQIFGAALGVLAGIICEMPADPKDGPLYTLTLFIASAIVSFVCSFFIKEELRRLKPKKAMEEECLMDGSGNLLPKENNVF